MSHSTVVSDVTTNLLIPHPDDTTDLACPAARSPMNSFFIHLRSADAQPFTHFSKKLKLKRTMGSGPSCSIMSKFLTRCITDTPTADGINAQNTLRQCVDTAAIATVIPMFNASMPMFRDGVLPAAPNAEKPMHKFIVQLCSTANVITITDWLKTNCSCIVKIEPYTIQLKYGYIAPIPPSHHPASVLQSLRLLAPAAEFTLPNPEQHHYSSRILWKCPADQLAELANLQGTTPWNPKYPLNVRIYRNATIRGCSRCFSFEHTVGKCTAISSTCSKCNQTSHQEAKCPNPTVKNCCFCKLSHQSSNCPCIKPTYSLLQLEPKTATVRAPTIASPPRNSASPQSTNSSTGSNGSRLSSDSNSSPSSAVWSGTLPPSISSPTSSVSVNSSTSAVAFQAELQQMIVASVQQHVQIAMASAMSQLQQMIADAMKNILAQLTSQLATMFNAATGFQMPVPPPAAATTQPTFATTAATARAQQHNTELLSTPASKIAVSTVRKFAVLTPSTQPPPKRSLSLSSSPDALPTAASSQTIQSPNKFQLLLDNADSDITEDTAVTFSQRPAAQVASNG
jgi:hypothetical protein